MATNFCSLHQVGIENSALREQLDRWQLKRAKTAQSMRAIEQHLLAFLSSSDGVLIADAGEMSKLNQLRKKQDKVRQDAERAADALEADRRSEEQYFAIAAAALQVSCALSALAESFDDSSFLVGMPVLQSVMERSLASSTNRASGRTEPNRLAQAAADLRLDLHRSISLGLESHMRRLFTVQLALTYMEQSGLLAREEAMLMVAICTHRKEPLEAARKAREERQQRDELEADRLRAAEATAASAPQRAPSRDGTHLGASKIPSGGVGKDKNAGATPTRAATANHPERPKMSHVHVPPATAHGARGGGGGRIGQMIDITEQPEQLKFIETGVWDEIIQLSNVWEPLKMLPASIYMDEMSFVEIPNESFRRSHKR